MIEYFLKSTIQQFKYYKLLGEKTFIQLEERELFLQFKNDNSIAIIVNHLQGNMKSRWTDFLISDGEKEWRNRDLEFEDVIKSKEELIEKWEFGWKVLFEAINSINVQNFNQKIFIRNESHSITEAIHRQLTHYAYHIGQIVFIGKMIKEKQWKSLSIPKGKSKDYNTKKFSE